MSRRLAIVETHPIQYKAPLFRALLADGRLNMMVYYAMLPDAQTQGAGFGVSFEWDRPLLEGYPYTVLPNRARNPSVVTFAGCDTPSIYDELKKSRPDAVLVNGWGFKSCLQALWACRRLGIPCMVRGESNMLRERPVWKQVGHRLLLKLYSGYLYIGSANKNFYLKHGCSPEKLFFAPYGVDHEYFRTAAHDRMEHVNALRTSFGINPDAVVFLFAGKFEDKKRPMDIVAALARLPGHVREKAHLLMVGAGPLQGQIETLARSSGVSATFAGFLNQSRIPDAYAAAHVLVLPSDAGETWGLVVNEAMASGRPAVVSRSVGCCADLIREGETGFSYPCGDVTALSNHVLAYLRDPGRADKQGHAAWQWIKHYEYSVVVEGINTAVASVVDGGTSV